MNMSQHGYFCDEQPGQTVKTLRDVGLLCQSTTACNSKLQIDGTYKVNLFYENIPCKSGRDPRTIIVQHATQETKETALQTLLDQAGFLSDVDRLCRNQNKTKDNCQISIKVNIAPASQKQYHYYTDPIIANGVAQTLKTAGYAQTRFVESETNAVLANPDINPTNFGQKLGFRFDVVDLTKEFTNPENRISVQFKKGRFDLARSMVESDVIINIPKPKNHDLMKFTAALKNMYGSIPDYNKYMLFHHKKSGIDVAGATVMVNHSTPADIIIADWVDSVDGNEVSYFKKEIDTFPHFASQRLIYGRDPLIIDKYIATKMGYNPSDSEIITTEEEFVGKKSINANFIEGDDLQPLAWKKVTSMLTLKAKLQDYIPVNDKLVAWGIRGYAFPIIK